MRVATVGIVAASTIADLGGTLTGRGGDVLIIDDPTKANGANSQIALEGPMSGFAIPHSAGSTARPKVWCW